MLLEQGKLERREYRTLTGLESDVKRMVNNAKAYNNNKSDIYLDAERIRKMTSNYMVKHNPAYEDKAYSAFATPLPSERAAAAGSLTGEKPDPPETAQAQSAVKAEATPAPAEARRITRGGNTPHESLRRSQSEMAVLDPDEEGYDPDFAGKTFQEAQRQLLNEMIKYKDDG